MAYLELILSEADSVTDIVSSILGFRPFSHLAGKQDFEELRQGVLHEK